MWTTHVKGVLISRAAMKLAFDVGQAVDALLTREACERAGETGSTMVEPADIEAAARRVTLALAELVTSLRAERDGSEEGRRVA